MEKFDRILDYIQESLLIFLDTVDIFFLKSSYLLENHTEIFTGKMLISKICFKIIQAAGHERQDENVD